MGKDDNGNLNKIQFSYHRFCVFYVAYGV
jgi:hypothetical protein